MIDSSQWFLLHAAYGRAILLTHVIEQRVSLQVALWHSIRTQGGDTAFSDRYEALRKRPFGTVLKLGIKEGAFSNDDAEVLELYRELRNLLVHEIADSITFRLVTKNDTDNVINELEDIANNFKGMSEELLGNVKLFYQLAGGKLEDLDRGLNALINHLAGLDVLTISLDNLEVDSQNV